MPGGKNLNIRASAEDLELFRQAATARNMSLTEHVLSVLRQASELVLAKRAGKEQPGLVSTTDPELGEDEERPLLKLSSNGYQDLPPHLYDQVDLRGKQPGDTVKLRGQFYRVPDVLY